MGHMEFCNYLEKAVDLGLGIMVREELLYHDRWSSFSGGFTEWMKADYDGGSLSWGNRVEELGTSLIVHFSQITGMGKISSKNGNLHLEIAIEIPDLL